jgi:hypothetical protein
MKIYKEGRCREMTKNRDKRHPALGSVFYPSLKRKTDKAKFILLGFAVITAAVIAGCPMEVNANIGPDKSSFTKAPPEEVKTVVQLPPTTVYKPVPGPDEPYELHRLRVVNISGTAITSVTVSPDPAGAAGPVIFSGAGGSIGLKESKVFIIDPVNIPPAPSAYSVSIAPHGYTTAPGSVTMPPDSVVLVDDSGAYPIPGTDLIPPNPLLPGEASIIVHNLSESYDISGIEVNGSLQTGSGLSRRNPPNDPGAFPITVAAAAPVTYTVTALRAPSASDVAVSVPVYDGAVVSVFIGDSGEVGVLDTTTPLPVKKLELEVDPGTNELVATWDPPVTPLPGNFDGYAVWFEGDSTPVNISINALPPCEYRRVLTTPGTYSLGVSSKDTNGNLSDPEGKSIIIYNKITDLTLSAAVLPPPAAYTKIAPAASVLPSPFYYTVNVAYDDLNPADPDLKNFEDITGSERFKANKKYTAVVTLDADPGYAFPKGEEITYSLTGGSTAVSARIAATGPEFQFTVTNWAKTGGVGQEWYLDGTKTLAGLDGSGSGPGADAVNRADVLVERIKAEKRTNLSEISPININVTGAISPSLRPGTGGGIMFDIGDGWPREVRIQSYHGSPYAPSAPAPAPGILSGAGMWSIVRVSSEGLLPNEVRTVRIAKGITLSGVPLELDTGTPITAALIVDDAEAFVEGGQYYIGRGDEPIGAPGNDVFIIGNQSPGILVKKGRLEVKGAAIEGNGWGVCYDGLDGAYSRGSNGRSQIQVYKGLIKNNNGGGIRVGHRGLWAPAPNTGLLLYIFGDDSVSGVEITGNTRYGVKIGAGVEAEIGKNSSSGSITILNTKDGPGILMEREGDSVARSSLTIANGTQIAGNADGGGVQINLGGVSGIGTDDEPSWKVYFEKAKDAVIRGSTPANAAANRRFWDNPGTREELPCGAMSIYWSHLPVTSEKLLYRDDEMASGDVYVYGYGYQTGNAIVTPPAAANYPKMPTKKNGTENSLTAASSSGVVAQW